MKKQRSTSRRDAPPTRRIRWLKDRVELRLTICDTSPAGVWKAVADAGHEIVRVVAHNAVVEGKRKRGAR